MPYNPEIHHRRSIRLKGYNYSQTGAYFITICTQSKECLFGGIVDGALRLNDYGKIVMKCWNDLLDHYLNIELDTVAIMPNHIHGIILISNSVGAGFKPAPTGIKYHGLPEIVRAFKTFSSRQINQIRNTSGIPVWQRNYYEHIIRDEKDLNQVRDYIINNPIKWALDEYNPENINDNENGYS